jgi:hypothetical protein
MLCYRRRRAATLGLTLPVAALITALWLGFVYSQPTAYLMFTTVALITVSDTASRRFEPALAAAALAQVALAFVWPVTSAYFTEWFRLVT